ncbi:decaprenyl-phosphate phosphoribosyltransferase, partial [Candidatus Beckwithbacteria bacterium CG23_combo_of_CG06-09_8_20_14_all_47_9]
MVKPLFLLLKAGRPRQSLKNLSLFTGLIFSGWLFIPAKFWTTVAAFFIFSLLTGSVYLFNDLLD